MLFLATVCAMLAIAIIAVPNTFQGAEQKFVSRLKKVVAAALGGISILTLGSGAFDYNEAGYCVHIRTIAGSETSKCDLGWYATWWGASTPWPHYITIANIDAEANAGGSSIDGPYTIRMADNWSGEVVQTTRFGIPQDEAQFLKMARDFRSPERLVTTTLRPAVTSSLDSIANLYTMEEYWTGGKRDEFKTEFESAIKKGRPAVERREQVVNSDYVDPDTAPSDSEVVADTAETGTNQSVRTVTVKKLDANGQEIRIQHDYISYGIIVSSAIVEKIDPDDRFEDRIQERKDAASRRIIAREKRLEEEEQRRFALAKAEREIAEKQGQARVYQIEQTTNAETQKRLALVDAEKQREQARIGLERSKIELQTAEVDAQTVKVKADADAYQRQQAIKADNALSIKLETEKAIQSYWADAFSRRHVPQVVIAGGGNSDVPVGSNSEVQSILQMLQVDLAKRLSYDRSISAQ